MERHGQRKAAVHLPFPLQRDFPHQDRRERRRRSHHDELVPVSGPGIVEQTHGVLRIWLDKEQTQRLLDGNYFATVVRKEKSCWIRGDLNGDTVFFMDNANPPADDEKEAGAFYNKAPRFSVYRGNAYDCEPVK